jgi:indole-3-pyruvate monooxygenase
VGEHQTETLVIGAGPAGLATGACLTRRGAPFVIGEQSTAVGASWRGHYDRIHLHTDRTNSALPFLGFPPGTARYPSRKEMIAYLEDYAKHFQLTPRLKERADNVRSEGSGWVTTTTEGIYRSRNVVIASGFNTVPCMPRWTGQESYRGRILHSSEYRNGEPFRGRNVLVVGFGNSAGEIAVDLHEHGARVAMSVRGPVNVVPRDILGLSILSVSIALSRFPARLADMVVTPLLRITVGDITKLGLRKAADGPITQIRERSKVPLVDVGTVRLVREGHIEVLRGIRSLCNSTVTFDDGPSRDFDAIIAATGFRPGLERFLESHSYSPDAERSRQASATGLYFCGFWVTPTGMFREIGIEARRIAHRITVARAG